MVIAFVKDYETDVICKDDTYRPRYWCDERTPFFRFYREDYTSVNRRVIIIEIK